MIHNSHHPNNTRLVISDSTTTLLLHMIHSAKFTSINTSISSSISHFPSSSLFHTSKYPLLRANLQDTSTLLIACIPVPPLKTTQQHNSRDTRHPLRVDLQVDPFNPTFLHVQSRTTPLPSCASGISSSSSAVITLINFTPTATSLAIYTTSALASRS